MPVPLRMGVRVFFLERLAVAAAPGFESRSPCFDSRKLLSGRLQGERPQRRQLRQELATIPTKQRELSYSFE